MMMIKMLSKKHQLVLLILYSSYVDYGSCNAGSTPWDTEQGRAQDQQDESSSMFFCYPC